MLQHNLTPLSSHRAFQPRICGFTGPLNEFCGYRFLIVIVDYFSRFIYGIPLVGISSEECVSAFTHNRMAFLGFPENIFCDQETQFTSSLWHEMCRFLGCQIKHSITYYP